MSQSLRQNFISIVLYMAIMLTCMTMLFFHGFDLMATMTGWLLPLSWPAQVMCCALALLAFCNIVSVLSQAGSAVAGFFLGVKPI
jgi:hypothetical protein